jgi:hypothetical protein
MTCNLKSKIKNRKSLGDSAQLVSKSGQGGSVRRES